MLRRLTSFSIHHRRAVLLTWVMLIIGATLAAGAWGGTDSQGGRLPGTDSDRAYQLLERGVPADPNITGDTAQFVFESRSGVDDPAVAGEIDSFLRQVGAIDGVVTAPPDHTALRRSPDGRVAAGEFSLRKADETATTKVLDAMTAFDRAHGGATSVAAAGWRFQQGGVPASEGVGLLAAAIILLIAFGSVVAMGLPIVTALAGIAIGLAGVRLWAALVPNPGFTAQVASMIGIGVGIDYALFIVTRYREALKERGDVAAAVCEAIDTAGRAVLFAGMTVMISLLGMLLMGLSFLQGLAFGTATAVLVAMAAAVTLLPALLTMVGHRLDRLSVHRRVHRDGETVWHRWSRFVQRHAVGVAVSGVVVLGALAVPTLSMRLASADAGNDPHGSTTRVAYDRIAEGFGAGFNGPLLVVVDPKGDASAEARLATQIQSLSGVAQVVPGAAAPSGVSVVTVVPTTGPQDSRTTDLVHRVRSLIHRSGATAHVGGQTANDVDFAALMSARLPVFIGAVLLFSFILLMVVFRSILVPLKAVVLNLLSIGAAYGVLVAVFQWGWLGSMVGVHERAPIEPWAPMMLFAIVFGLSMDYEVFLLSSMKERVQAGQPNSTAVVEGLASTARVITAAAAIMVCVFGSFVLGDLRAIKLIGLGLSVAVLLDATVVRMLLVPATMELLGERNWWWPGRRAEAPLVRHAAAHATTPVTANARHEELEPVR
jgi:putative drug exporter of the RND superfamily